MSSIKEIAKKANVSTATVSRVLNDSSTVKPETKKKVLDTIDRFDYSPNMMGVNLRNGSNKIIVTVVPSISNPVFSAMCDGVENCAAYHGYRILIAVTNGIVDKELEFYEMVKNKLADGVLSLSSTLDVATVNTYVSKIPMVSCSNTFINHNVPLVTIDNEQAVYDVVKYLYDTGKRKIAYMGIDKKVERDTFASLRERGYRRAVKELKLEFEPDMVINSGYDYFSGQEESEKLIKLHPDLDAIVCATDIMAFNTIKTLELNGKRVPDDISVTGFDNGDFSLISSPQITSIDQANYETGYRAMEALWRQITTGTVEKQMIFIPHRIVKRESTGYKNNTK